MKTRKFSFLVKKMIKINLKNLQLNKEIIILKNLFHPYTWIKKISSLIFTRK